MMGACEVLKLVLKICPRFLSQSRSDVLLLAFMHKEFILLILQFDRDQFFHKRGFRPSICTHAKLFMLSNISLTLILKCPIVNNKTKLHSCKVKDCRNLVVRKTSDHTL